MKIKVAFDLSGLAWHYRTGVQNLYWAFVDAWTKQPQLKEKFDVLFYDRSGSYNHDIAFALGQEYKACAPSWWPTWMRRPLQAVIRTTNVLAPEIDQRINHVWNWNIHHPSRSHGSITIPDVLPLEFPQWFDSRFQRLTEQSLHFAANHAEYVFVISHDVQQRVAKLTGLSTDRIHVVYPGIDAAYFSIKQYVPDASVLKKHSLEAGRYLISSGFLDPRKNLVRQLQAFSIAIARGAKGIKYALTGLPNAHSDQVLKLIESDELRSNVVFLGYVSKDDLIILTRNSLCMMYCSLAEGFGLPIVEAMAVGAHVVTSSNTSMFELASRRASIVDPYNVEAIAQAIEEVIYMSSEEKHIRVENNRLFASRFTAENWLGGHLDRFSGSLINNRWV